jgi:hypothetical protein
VQGHLASQALLRTSFDLAFYLVLGSILETRDVKSVLGYFNCLPYESQGEALLKFQVLARNVRYAA